MKHLGNLSIIAISLAMGASLLSYGPSVESAIYPVLVDQKPTASRDGNVVTFDNVVTKRRDCKIVSLSYHAVDRSGSIETRIPVRVVIAAGLRANESLASYPPGTFRNGPFETVLPDFMSHADEIIGAIEYRCHALWLTPQTYGPFQIPPAP